MYELQQAGPQSFYINCPAKIGVYVRSGNEVYLIDSGNDKEAAKKVLKIAEHPLQCRPYRRQCVYSEQNRLPCIQFGHRG